MSTATYLLPLALLASKDPEARPVLHDAIEETGWDTRANGIRVHKEMYHPEYSIWPEWDGEHVRQWFRTGFRMSETSVQAFVDAIVVVLQGDASRAPSDPQVKP